MFSSAIKRQRRRYRYAMCLNEMIRNAKMLSVCDDEGEGRRVSMRQGHRRRCVPNRKELNEVIAQIKNGRGKRTLQRKPRKVVTVRSDIHGLLRSIKERVVRRSDEESSRKMCLRREHGPLKLTRTTHSMKITCDICRRDQLPRSSIFSCRRCNYDVCLECYYGRKMIRISNWKEGRGPKKKKDKPPSPRAISPHLYKFAKSAMKVYKSRDVKVSGLKDTSRKICLDGVRSVKISECCNTHFQLHGRVTRVKVNDCRNCTITVPSGHSFHVVSTFSLALCENVTVDLRGASRSSTPVVVVDRASSCVLCMRTFSGKLYTSSTSDFKLLTGTSVASKCYCVRSQRPSEDQYLITYVGPGGHLVTEHGVRVGLTLIPESEANRTS